MGITKHLVEALEIFSGDLEPQDVMTDIEGEKTILENRHTKLVNYFKKIKYDRFKERNEFILKAVEYLQPQDIKDKFKERLRDFNKSMNIVLPDAFASQFDYDFKLFNELKLMVRDEKEKITRDESKKLQMIIDEHLRSKGIEYLLSEPIDISDYQKFKQKLEKEGSHTPPDKAKAIIKANEKEHPELALELSELLEKIILERKSDRRQAAADLFSQMEEVIKRHKSRYTSAGLQNEKQLVVYDAIEKLTDKPAELTLEIYNALDKFLENRAIMIQSNAQKDMRNRIKPILSEYSVEKKYRKR